MFESGSLIQYGGLLILFLAVFAQTGLFFCFFIPSGALLFTTGVFVASGDLSQNIFTVCGLLILASFLGNITGYWVGLKAGPIMYRWHDSRFFKRKYLDSAEAFYQKHGNIALSVGLFLPIIRTFAPIVSGMIKMDIRRFMLYTFLGSACWILSFVVSGYLVGTVPVLRPYLKYIVIAIIVLISAPVVITIIRKLRKSRR